MKKIAVTAFRKDAYNLCKAALAGEKVSITIRGEGKVHLINDATMQQLTRLQNEAMLNDFGGVTVLGVMEPVKE